MKTVVKILGILALAVVLVIVGFALVMNNGMNEVKAASVGTVNLSSLADGQYEGTYHAGRFTNTVAVTVKDGKITGINADKTVTFERPEITKTLFDSVLAQQNTDVDVESGATLTSKAYLKSIENALTKK